MQRRLILPLLAAAAVLLGTAVPAHAVGTSLRPSAGVTPTGTGDGVFAVATIGTEVVIGGNFSTVVNPNGTTSPAGGLAALDTTTGALVWAANPGGMTYSLTTDGTNIYAGGTYGVQKFSQSGVPQPFKAKYSFATVRAEVFTNGELFYGGDGGLAAVTATGAGVWRDTAKGVRSMALVGSQLLVGSRFCGTAGGSAATLVAVNLNGTLNTSFFSPSFACIAGAGQPPLSIAVSNGQAYVGAGGKLNKVFDIDPTTGLTVWQTTHGDGDVQSVAVQGGQLYIGGHFDCVNGGDPGVPCLAPRLKIARYSLTGVLDPTWTPNLTAGFLGVWAMTGDANQLYVGGEFTRVNGVVRNKFAIFGS